MMAPRLLVTNVSTYTVTLYVLFKDPGASSEAPQ